MRVKMVNERTMKDLLSRQGGEDNIFQRRRKATMRDACTLTTQKGGRERAQQIGEKLTYAYYVTRNLTREKKVHHV